MTFHCSLNKILTSYQGTTTGPIQSGPLLPSQPPLFPSPYQALHFDLSKFVSLKKLNFVLTSGPLALALPLPLEHSPVYLPIWLLFIQVSAQANLCLTILLKIVPTYFVFLYTSPFHSLNSTHYPSQSLVYKFIE